MVLAYHGTGFEELESILRDRTIYSFMGSALRGIPQPIIRNAQNVYLREYNQFVSEFSRLAKEQEMADKFFITLGTEFTDEVLADLFETYGIEDEVLRDKGGDYKRGDYKELKRICFAWFSKDPSRVIRWTRDKTNQSILEFDIPDRRVRKGYTGNDILVWWQLETQYLKNVYVPQECINITKDLLKKDRKKVKVRSLQQLLKESKEIPTLSYQ